MSYVDHIIESNDETGQQVSHEIRDANAQGRIATLEAGIDDVVDTATAAATQATQAAQTASDAARRAAQRAEDAIDAIGDISELPVPLMSPDVRGGAKIGSGLTVEDETLSVDTSALVTQAEKGAANGVAELDQNGLVLSSQLPSYVDDVLEYPSAQDFPATGESGKIYVATDTNLTYRWTGSTYAEISPSLALGETSSTAYRGDRGAAAYAHAVTNKGAAFSSNLYKITTNSEGHVTAATPATSADIVAFLNAQALTPASVTATGAIQGTSISDSVGSLADLRDSVHLVPPLSKVAFDQYNGDVRYGAIEFYGPTGHFHVIFSPSGITIWDEVQGSDIKHVNWS